MADFDLENPTFDPDGHGIDNDKSFDLPDAIMDPLPLWGRVAESVRHQTRKSGVLGSKPGLATYFRFSFRFFKKGSCQLLAKICARSTG